MIYELTQTQYDRVKPLFRQLKYQLFCPAVLEGIQPGRVFVDDPTNPQTAFMVTRDAWCYLAGQPDNDAFNSALKKAIYSREIIDQDAWGLLFSCHPESWKEGLASICHPRQPIEIPRRHYTGGKLDYDWRANTPEGFRVELVDESLLDHQGSEVPEDVKNLIKSWESTIDPKHRGFGFVTLYQDPDTDTEEIAAHAVIDCIVGDCGDIGLVTADAYRRRGLATITAAAAVEYGLSHGLSRILWDCGEHNIGSLRTADKLGFEYQRNHTMYGFGFDETQHLVNLAWTSLDAESYQKTIEACELIFDQGKNTPSHAHYLASVAWAGLGNPKKALQYLDSAAEQGWTAVGLIESRKEFKDLRDTVEWTAVLDRMRQTDTQR